MICTRKTHIYDGPKAFRGELMEQDPNDPPASELLESIRKQRQRDSVAKASKKGKGNSAGRRGDLSSLEKHRQKEPNAGSKKKIKA